MPLLISALLLGVSVGLRANADPSLDSNISFQCAGMPASRALKELSQTAGVPLSARGEVQDIVLVLDFQDVPLKEVLPRIAMAADAEWSESGSGFALSRSPKLQQKLQQQHLALTAKAFREAQDRIRKQLASEAAFDEAAARRLGLEIGAFAQNVSQANTQPNFEGLSTLEGKLPVGAMAKRLTLLLDPTALAQLENHEVAVFTLNPNRMQRALPAGARAEAERFARETAMLAGHLPKGADAQAMMRLGTGMRNVFQWNQFSSTAPATLLCKVVSQEDRRFRVEVSVANEAGKHLGSANVYMATEREGTWPPRPGAAPTGEKPIELSTEADELIAGIKTAMSRGGGAGDFPELSTKLREILLNPEKHELAEAGAGPMLIGAARAKGRHIAACVPDFMAFLLPMMSAVGFTTPSSLLGGLNGPYMESETKDEGGWLVVHPMDPIEVTKPFVERSLLGQTIRSIATNGSLSLDELANFAARLKGLPEESVLMPYLLLVGSKSANEIGNQDWHFLKLHGLLSGQQKQALFAGRALRMSELSGPVQTHISKMIYWGQIRSFRNRTPVRIDPEQYEAATRLNDVEPTLLYPGGLPGDTMITASASIGPTIKFRGTQQGGYDTSGDWSPASAASYLLAKERNDPQSWEAMLELKSFQAGEKTEITYEMDAGGPTTYLGSVRVFRLVGNPVDRMDKLPADIWGQIQQQVKLQREAANNRRIPPRR